MDKVNTTETTEQNKLPVLALCTMSFNPHFKVNSIKEADSQSYLDEGNLIQYILHQRDRQGNFPPHYEAVELHPNHKLIEMDVDGEWPGLWMFKLIACVDDAKARGIPLLGIFDEDDAFRYDFLEEAVKPFKPFDSFGPSPVSAPSPALISWNYWNLEIKGNSIRKAKYGFPWGTMVARTDALHHLIHEFAKICPTGLIFSRMGKNKHKPATWHGPLDGPFVKFIHSKVHPDRIVGHNGIRWYIHQGKSSTAINGHRKPGENIEWGYADYM